MNRRSFFKALAAIAAVPSALIARVRRIWHAPDSVSFKKALDNASDGDIIVLSAGHYYTMPFEAGQFEIKKHVTIVSGASSNG